MRFSVHDDAFHFFSVHFIVKCMYGPDQPYFCTLISLLLGYSMSQNSPDPTIATHTSSGPLSLSLFLYG